MSIHLGVSCMQHRKYDLKVLIITEYVDIEL